MLLIIIDDGDDDDGNCCPLDDRVTNRVVTFPWHVPTSTRVYHDLFSLQAAWSGSQVLWLKAAFVLYSLCIIIHNGLESGCHLSQDPRHDVIICFPLIIKESNNGPLIILLEVLFTHHLHMVGGTLLLTWVVQMFEIWWTYDNTKGQRILGFPHFASKFCDSDKNPLLLSFWERCVWYQASHVIPLNLKIKFLF